MHYEGIPLPPDVKQQPFRCVCGRELELTRSGIGYALKRCSCGRSEWSLPAGKWCGYDDRLLYLFPTDPAAPDPRD